jgi:hypothetical protein
MFKKIATVLLAITLATGCADNRNLNVPGKGMIEVETYGFLNEVNHVEDCVNYELSMGNVIWSVILSETLVMPVYFVGFSLYEPVSIDQACAARYLKNN